CGEAYTDMHGHDLIWVVDRAPTTEETGLQHKECTVCGYQCELNTPIAVLPDESLHKHTFWVNTLVEEKKATCTEDGWVKHYECSCGLWENYYGTHLIAEPLAFIYPATGHNYIDRYDEDTHYRVCSNCGDRQDEAAHTMDWVYDTEPTTERNGWRHQECTVCGYKYPNDLGEAVGHIHSYSEEYSNYSWNAANYGINNGYNDEVHFRKCSFPYCDEYIDAQPHTFEWVVSREPSLYENGV
ncbi:MAG: hypothetical protein IJ711_08115, partial [Lachnospiraceae bacterium]|nr:hypothetical protein [Lachnospiraceae bacterium]